MQFSDIITFTRASGGGRFNAQGVYEWLPANQPRFDYDPVTGEAKGLLIEEQRTNLLTYSSDFANAAWFKSNSTITANAAVAPDGTMTASKLVMTAGTDPNSANNTGIQNLNRVDSGTSVSSLSFFAKAGEVSSIRIRENISTGAFLTVDLSTGAITIGNSTQFGSPSAVNFGNGWWRISFTTAIGSTSGSRFGLRANAVGDGTSGIYIWGAQLETGAFPTSYIPTTTAQVTRAADIARVNELSPWFNPEQGTVIVKASLYPRASGFPPFFELSPDFHVYRAAANGNVAGNGRGSSGFSVIPIQPQRSRVATRYTDSNVQNAANGAVGELNNLTRINATTSLNIGWKAAAGAGYLNGHIESLQFIPRALTNTELQRITA